MSSGSYGKLPSMHINRKKRENNLKASLLGKKYIFVGVCVSVCEESDLLTVKRESQQRHAFEDPIKILVHMETLD